jgi:hypothetical protein
MTGVVLGALLVFMVSSCSASSDDSVTTAEGAIANARRAWRSTHEKAPWKGYSEEWTSQFEPYTATYEEGVWVVRGTIPAGYRGEVLETQVRERGGSVSVTVVQIE